MVAHLECKNAFFQTTSARFFVCALNWQRADFRFRFAFFSLTLFTSQFTIDDLFCFFFDAVPNDVSIPWWNSTNRTTGRQVFGPVYYVQSNATSCEKEWNGCIWCHSATPGWSESRAIQFLLLSLPRSGRGSDFDDFVSVVRSFLLSG